MSFDVTNPVKPTIVKDPDAILDYSQDWSAWLEDSDDALASVVVTPNGTMTVVGSPQIASGVVTARLEGGVAGSTESVTYHIVTVGGQEDERTLFFKIKER